jgi:hypothetical protein
MATDFERMSGASRAIDDTRTMGGAPRDGDFARLLQAASQPAAHRLHAGADSMVTSRTADPARRLPLAPEAMRPEAEAPRMTPGSMLEQPVAPPAAVRRDITASLLGRWLAMPMRDRVITGLFTLGGIAFVLNILRSAMESADDGFGVLLIFGVIVFFILSARSRKSRNTP